MKGSRWTTGATLAGMLLATQAFAGEKWGYTGKEGPEHWAELSPAYALCGSGRNQSPVNLDQMIEAELPPITFEYGGQVTEVVNNGHTIKANYAPGSAIKANGKTYELKQFHFHSPSENTIAGKSFPMEAHFVHAAKDGSLAVVAVMMETGEASPAIEKLWSRMPQTPGRTATLKETVTAESLLPDDRDHYRFNGSLTTPPCTEGVLWLVMKKPITISEAQLKAFQKVMKHPNNRPVQPLNARAVLK